MQGSVSQPDLCLYFSTVQALKAHQPAARPSPPEIQAAVDQPVEPTGGHLALRPRWLARLVVSSR